MSIEIPTGTFQLGATARQGSAHCSVSSGFLLMDRITTLDILSHLDNPVDHLPCRGLQAQHLRDSGWCT